MSPITAAAQQIQHNRVINETENFLDFINSKPPSAAGSSRSKYIHSASRAGSRAESRANWKENIKNKEVDSETDLDPFEAFRLAEQDEAVRAFNKQEKIRLKQFTQITKKTRA